MLVKKATSSIILGLSFVPGVYGQLPRTTVSPAGDIVAIEMASIQSAASSPWYDVTSYGSSTHKLTFTYIAKPSAVTVALECSNDRGATVTSTIGTSTSTTGATISGTGTCNAVRASISGLTGTIDIRPVYQGSLPPTISVAGGDGAILDGVNSALKATVLDLTNTNPLMVGIADGTGSQITSFGGGIQYTEGDVDASITGTALLFEGAGNVLVAAPGTATDGLLVNLGANNDVTVTSGAITANAGTNLNTSALALETGGNLASAVTALQLIDNAVSGAGFNITQFAGVNSVTGSGTATGALRVELPTNGTGVIATVTAVTAITNALPSGTNNIGDVDILSIVPGTGATNQGKAVDGVAGATDTGILALVVRDDALTTLTPADGDYTQARVDSVGRLWVNCGTGCAGGTQYVIGTVSGATDTVTMTGLIRDDALTTLADADGDVVTGRVDSVGRLWVNCGTGCSGGTQYTIGAASGATDTVTMAGAIRDDALSTLADADGDVVGLRVNSTGALWVQSSQIDAAEDAAVATNPVPIGGVYRTASVTLDNGDVGYPRIDVDANLQVVGTGTAGTAAGGVVTVQGVASMTKLLVTPDSVALPANQSVNVSQVNGVTVLMGNGTTGTGSQRVTIASDNTAFSVNPLSATAPVSTMNSASANSGLNSAMALVFDDTTPTTITENSFGFARMSANRNQYVTMRDAAGNERGLNIDANNNAGVVLAAETTKVVGTVRALGNVGGAFDAATGAAPPANVIYTGGLTSGATGGLLTGVTVCDSTFNVNVATATTTLAVTGVSGRHVRICSLDLITAAANNVGIISGTGATCGTGTAAIVGTTAATGYNFAANGGIATGSGIGMIKRTVATGDSVCIITSAGTQLSGTITYTIF